MPRHTKKRRKKKKIRSNPSPPPKPVVFRSPVVVLIAEYLLSWNNKSFAQFLYTQGTLNRVLRGFDTDMIGNALVELWYRQSDDVLTWKFSGGRFNHLVKMLYQEESLVLRLRRDLRQRFRGDSIALRHFLEVETKIEPASSSPTTSLREPIPMSSSEVSWGQPVSITLPRTADEAMRQVFQKFYQT